jgi:alanyl-tRNA synthetase
MQTERLYFADPYLTRFSARVVARGERDGRPAVALDQSAFYPEGGGQPADTGSLGGVAVRDVQAEDGLVWHVLAAPLEADSVQGEVDWARRFDHMQQHHGQHLLSAAFEQLYGLRTLSFHLGASAATIDLGAPALAAEQAAAAEDLANQVIWEDRPVLARFVSAEELARLPLRKPPSVEGPIRVVSVPDFDHSACGGTHPRATGGVGVLHIRRWERRGDTTRVEFLCGGRALRDLRWKNAALGRLATAMSVGAEEVEAAVVRLRENEERARKLLEDADELGLPDQLLPFVADQLLPGGLQSLAGALLGLAQPCYRRLDLVGADAQSRRQPPERRVLPTQVAQRPPAAEEFDPHGLAASLPAAHMQQPDAAGRARMGAAAGRMIEVGHRNDANRAIHDRRLAQR